MIPPEPGPDPPEPELEELSVNTANAKGVIYVHSYDSTQPDVQTYDKFEYEGVEYTLSTGDNIPCYLAINRSANEGDSVKLGWFKTSNNRLYINQAYYTTNNGTAVGKITNVDKPTLTPSNSDLQAKFNNNDASVVLSEVVR